MGGSLYFGSTKVCPVAVLDSCTSNYAIVKCSSWSLSGIDRISIVSQLQDVYVIVEKETPSNVVGAFFIPKSGGQVNNCLPMLDDSVPPTGTPGSTWTMTLTITKYNTTNYTELNLVWTY